MDKIQFGNCQSVFKSAHEYLIGCSLHVIFEVFNRLIEIR